MTPLRTRALASTGGVILAAFVILFLVGAIPRFRASRALAAARGQRPHGGAGRLRDCTTARGRRRSIARGHDQAFQDTTIFARTNGYISRRLVDIGDRVRAGQLLAEIASPEIDRQLEQANADHRQSQRALDQQKATLELARATSRRYQGRRRGKRGCQGGGRSERRRGCGPARPRWRPPRRTSNQRPRMSGGLWS